MKEFEAARAAFIIGDAIAAMLAGWAWILTGDSWMLAFFVGFAGAGTFWALLPHSQASTSYPEKKEKKHE